MDSGLGSPVLIRWFLPSAFFIFSSISCLVLLLVPLPIAGGEGKGGDFSKQELSYRCQAEKRMKSQSSYMPPPYIPLDRSEPEVETLPSSGDPAIRQPISAGPTHWSSGICACFDDLQSCCIGLFCPCYLFGKNAEFLGSGTLMGSCSTHFLLWALVNTVCCLLTDGILLGLPGCFVACYACGYRSALRSKYNLEEAPCGDFVTHCFCHLCAICQEYREIRERSGDANPPNLTLAVVTAPPVQMMDSPPKL